MCFYYDKIKTKEEALKAVKYDAFSLKWLSRKLRNDKEIVLAAINKNGLSISYATNKLKNDKEIILASIEKNPHSFKYIGKKFKNDKEFIKEACKISGQIIEYIGRKLKKDKDLCYFTIKNAKNCEYCFEFFSKKVRKDKQLTKLAIARNSYMFKATSLKNKNDYDIVMEACKNDGKLLQYASKKMRKNKEICLEAIKQNVWAFKYASKEFKDDKDLAMNVLNQFVRLYRFVSPRLKKDKDIILRVLKEPVLIMKNKEYDEIVNIILKNYKNDREFIIDCIFAKNTLFYKFSNLINFDKEVILNLVKNNENILKDLDITFKNDINFLKQCLKVNPKCILILLKEIIHFSNKNECFSLCYEFLKESINSFFYLPNELLLDDEFLENSIYHIENPFYIVKMINDNNFKETLKYNKCMFFEEKYLEKFYFYILKYLETTDFIYEYRIDILRKMNVDELGEFLGSLYSIIDL